MPLLDAHAETRRRLADTERKQLAGLLTMEEVGLPQRTWAELSSAMSRIRSCGKRQMSCPGSSLNGDRGAGTDCQYRLMPLQPTSPSVHSDLLCLAAM